MFGKSGRLLAMALFAGLIPASALAAPAQAAVSCVDSATDEATAASLAKACSGDVVVSMHTTETMLAVAEPSGRIRWTQSVAPVRIKRSGGWVAVDTSLRLVSGSPAPVASTLDVRFSKGGSDPLITVNDRGGSVSLSWPSPLPVPVLDRDAAVYPEVFAGVDLRVRATATGFTHVLVVKNSSAAANPELRSVRYGWKGSGLSVRSGADGTVQIVDDLGSVRLASAPATMWDSDTGEAPAGPGAKASASMSASDAGRLAEGAAAPSDADSAGDAAAVAPVNATATGSEVAVMPDAAMLASASSLVYPLFIDPSFNLGLQRWAYMNSNGNTNNDSHARVGNNVDGYGIYRSLFQFDISDLKGRTVYAANFNTVLYHSSACNDTPVSLWYGHDIPGGVSNGSRAAWNSGELITHLEEKWAHANKGGGCGRPNDPDVPMTFSGGLASRLQISADQPGWTYITVVLSTANWNNQGESDQSWWKKFWWSPSSMTAWTNASPQTPVVQPFSGTTECYKACTSSTVSNSDVHVDGWWKLNEMSGITAADSSGKAHPATVSSGVSWCNGVACLNGSTGWITTNAPVLTTSQSYTMSIWVYLTSTANYFTAVGQAGPNANAFYIQYVPGANTWRFISPSTDSQTPSAWYSAQASVAASLSTWTHLTGVFDASNGKMSLYVNGGLAATATNSSPWAANGNLCIGCAIPGVNAWPGALANVQAYQRPLSSQEVSTLYGSGRSGGALRPAIVRTTQPTLTVQVSDPDSQMLKTDFEIRTAATDTATLVSSTQIGDRASGTNVPWPVPSGKLTHNSTYFWRARAIDDVSWVSPWTPWQVIKIDTSAPSPPTSVSSALFPYKQWGATPGTLGTFTTSAAAGSNAVEAEWWVDGGGHTMTPVSGVTASFNHAPPADMVHTVSVKLLDSAGNPSGTYDHQFWVSPVTARFSHWKLDEVSGDAGDSGNGNTVGGSSLTPGTLSASGVAFGPGYVGGSNGAVFTGDAQIDMSTPVLDTAKSFTVMAWVNPSNLDSDRVIVSQDGAASSRFQLFFDKEANSGSGGWCMGMRQSDGGTLVTACADGSSWGYPALAEWVHVAGVYESGTGKLRVYFKGDPLECAGEMTESSFTGSWSATGSLVIGRGKAAGASSSYWRGSVDDVYAYQKVLTAEQICQQAAQ